MTAALDDRPPSVVRLEADMAAFAAECAEVVRLTTELADRFPQVADALRHGLLQIADGLAGVLGQDGRPAAAGEPATLLVSLQLSEGFRVLLAALRAAHHEATASDRVHSGSPSSGLTTAMVTESPPACEVPPPAGGDEDFGGRSP